MSNLNDIIRRVNSLTGYKIPTGSYSYYISASGPLSSGSVNSIVNQINQLTGYNISPSNVTFVSGTNVASPVMIYVPADPGGDTISTEGIYPGAVIKADHVLRIIRALNGTANNAIIISGSLYVSGSATMASSLDLPFAPDENVLLSDNGFVSGSGVLDGGTF